MQDFQFVAQSDLRQPLTYVHPAVKAVGGASGVSESNMAYDVIEEACTLETDTGTPSRDEPPGVTADTGVRGQLAGVDSEPHRRVVAGVREPPEPSPGATGGTGTSDATLLQPAHYTDAIAVS